MTENRGFTLLEVMAAVAIIAIVLTAIFRLHAQTLSMNYSARFYTTAPLLAQSRMAEIETDPDASGGSDSGDFGDSFPGYAWEVNIEDVESETLGEAAEDLKRIELSVSLNGGEFNYRFVTYRLMPDRG